MLAPTVRAGQAPRLLYDPQIRFTQVQIAQDFAEHFIANFVMTTQAIEFQTLCPERFEAQATFQLIHLRCQCLCFCRVIENVKLMPVFRHDPRLQLRGQRCLSSVRRIIRVNHLFGLQRMDGGFYLWPKVEGDDAEFCRDLFKEEHVTVVPGSYLSREVDGVNPGAGRVRMALVAPLAECVEAAKRIRAFIERQK